MSLFQAREWWSMKAEQHEEYTYGALAIGNIDNDSSGQAKIITGSLHGMLRIYFPTGNEFKIEHLLLEENLRYPILQIEVGYFIPNQRVLALAVLHPRRLGIYSVEGVGGNGMSASYFKLSLRFEHLLGIDGEHFTSFNMIVGPFGNFSSGRNTTTNTHERDQLCVQSLDGRLQFFEQDRFVFMQQLSNTFIPGPICYIPGMDAIVVTTSDMQLECYRYQVLASASLKFNKQEKATPSSYSSSNSNNSHRTSTGMTGNFEWKLNLGEQILDIRLGKYHSEIGQSNYDLLVLTEFSLFCLRPNGDIVFQKRLGFQPSTLCLYRRLPQASEGSNDVGHSIHNAIITGHHKVWMIYGDKSLLWSACAPSIPVAMEVGEFGNLQGMIVALDAEGSLSINYLGTDPPSTSVGASDVAKEINYEEMDEEHRQLLNVIRRSQGERRIEPKERVLIRAQVPSMLDPIHSYDDIRRSSNRNTNNPEENAQVQLTMRIYVTYTGNSRVNNVTLSIQTPENIIASESSIVLDYIDGKSSTPLILPIVLRPSTNVMPRSLNVNIAAAYTLETGQPRVSQCQVKLPMCMMCRLIPPVKSSTFKFTLETNQDPPQLTDLFEDMLTQPGCTPEWAKQVGGSGTNVMSFQYYNGVDATILVSKNAGRYRIQSNELEALWMVSKELVERLEALYQSNDMRLSNSDSKQEHQQETASKFEVFYQEPLPLADFFGAIDAHFAQRKAKMELAAEINDRAHQFRIIQKRLLVRYKDRNPSALNCLEVLLHGTYEQLIQLSHAMEEVDLKLSMASNRLSCCVHLILMLIKYRFNLDDASGNTLASYLSPIINDHGEQGWEEATDSAMTELLRTLLAKTQTKDNNQTNNNASLLTQELTMLEDTKKLKKHITIVCDRLGKGAILSDSGSSSTSSGSSTPQEAK